MGFDRGLLVLPYGALAVFCAPYPTGLRPWFVGLTLQGLDCGLWDLPYGGLTVDRGPYSTGL